MLIKILNTLLTIVAGVGVALALFWVLNKLTELLPNKWEERLKPYAYIFPAILAITIYLVYPALQTILDSFANQDSTKLIGLKNYTTLFQSTGFRQTLLNTFLWVLVAPVAAVILGLGVAVLVDRLRPGAEKLSKTVIFLPMAISAVGAATVWRFIYATNPPNQSQIGLQNAIITKLGHDPVAWLEQTTLHANTLLLIVMFLWSQVGFSMVLLSAAIKSVPIDTLEAARIDGASERQIFGRVVIPQIMATVITVYVTVAIGVLKLFDIVYVMTNGNANTNVLATQFFNELTTNFNNGAAAAVVVMIMIVVLPVMIFQVRQFRILEESR